MLSVFKHTFQLSYKDPPEGFQGPSIRGGIGIYLKKLVDSPDYDYLFNTPTDEKIMKRYDEAPKSFVIDLPYASTSPMCLNLLLFARSSHYFPAFRRAIFELASRNGIDVFYDGCSILSGDFASELKTFAIHFDTPLFITYRGRLLEKPEFHILIRNILRRIFLVAYYHYCVRLPIDFSNLIEEAEKVKLVSYGWSLEKISRYSSRKKRNMILSGYIGSAHYEMPDNLLSGKDLLGFLSLGEIIHTGKNTAFGFGKFRVKGE